MLFYSAVIFTYVDFNESSPEWHSWQYVDRGQLEGSSVSTICKRIFRKAHIHIGNTDTAKWYHGKSTRPSKEQVERIAEILRGDFEYYISPRVLVDETERTIHKFTEEQFAALDVIDENPRIVYKGPAGTGKTLLAIEATKRLSRQGLSTLLICYNRLLGGWLRKETASLVSGASTNLSVSTFHGELLRLSGLSEPSHVGNNFWSHELPDRVVEVLLTNSGNMPLYNVVVIDEAQDLIAEKYLDVLDLLLVGGLTGGRWLAFGDFDRQAIYGRKLVDDTDNMLDLLISRAPSFFSFPLRINCRNSKPIALGLQYLCGLEPAYIRMLDNNTDIEIQVAFYKSEVDQIDMLAKYLGELKDSFDEPEIVILSFKEDPSSCVGKLHGVTDTAPFYSLKNGSSGRQTEGKIGYSSIHSFKGLESPAVIITDIANISGEKAEALLYIGISRARVRLILLMDEKCRESYVRALEKNIS